MWTLRGEPEGVLCGVAVGIFLTSFGLLAFSLFGQWSPLFVDGARGGLKVFLGLLLLRSGAPVRST